MRTKLWKHWRLLSLCTVVVLSLLPGKTSHAQSAIWTAQYFNNPDLQGAPIAIRQENTLNYFWGDSSPIPQVPTDNFSVQWTTTQVFSAGSYRFTLAGDDGVRLYIDNQLVINQWHDQSYTVYTTIQSLTAGSHVLRIEYYDRIGAASVSFSYVAAPLSGLTPREQSGAWYGQYFTNPNLQGFPLLERYDGSNGLQFDWSSTSPAPGFPRQSFSVRWTRQFCTTGRSYTFDLTVDDGARLYVGDVLVIDAWNIRPGSTIQKQIQ